METSPQETHPWRLVVSRPVQRAGRRVRRRGRRALRSRGEPSDGMEPYPEKKGQNTRLSYYRTR